MKTILDYFPSAKQKTHNEWAAPCPSCGGDDRFVIKTDGDKGGRFFCRHCKAKGSGIDFLVNFKGMAKPEACSALELPLQGKKTSGTVTQPKANKQSSPLPCEQWRNAAASLMREYQKNLRHPEAVAALKARHLTPQTAAAVGIGWNVRNEYLMRSKWGLPEIEDKIKLRIPRGLVISTRRKLGTVALTIRQPEAQPKYWQVQGSQDASFVIGQADVPVFLFESALDAALLWQETQGECATVAFMGATKRVDESTVSFVNNAPLIVACPDDDDAGHKAWAEWRKLFPLAVRVRPLSAKDLTDMHTRSTLDSSVPTVAQWAKIALQIAIEARETKNATHDIGRDALEPQSENIDLKSFSLAEICADPELVRLYREQFPFKDGSNWSETIFCHRGQNGNAYGWRSKRDCIGCTGHKHCYLPIVDNPFIKEQTT